MSTFWITCWGCDKTEQHEWIAPEDHDEKVQEMRSRGWCRRLFGPGADPWFCSQECAHESFNAKRAEEIWAQKLSEDSDKEFVQYCKETSLPTSYLVALVLFLMFAVIGSIYVRLP